MVLITSAADTCGLGTPGYKVPIVVTQTETKEPSAKPTEPIEETLNDRNKKWGKIIQDYLNGDDDYKKSHKSHYTRAKRQLAESNRFLVVNIAKGFLGKGLSLDDLIGDGNIGLMRAVEDYNPKFEFSTYAFCWIKQSIIRGMHGEIRGNLPITYHLCSNRSRINRIESELEKELGRKPENEEIAKEFNDTFYPDKHSGSHIRGYHVEALKIAVNTPLSITIKTKSGYECDFVASKEPNPSDALSIKEEIEKSQRLYSSLDEREKTILSLFYGLGGNEPKNFSEIGKILGYTRERIRQIHRDTLIKLRGKMYPEDKAA